MSKKEIVVVKILLMIARFLTENSDLKKEIHDLTTHISLYGEKLS